MSLEDLRTALPDYAKDQRINLTNVLQSEQLNEQQLWGCAVSTAIATKNATLMAATIKEAESYLSPEAMAAAKAAATIMGMNNIYYRFQHVASNANYKNMPARLRMQVIARPGVEHADFELWCLAVSAINGCSACVDSHEKVVLEKGLSEAAVLDAVRIASVMHAAATALNTEEAIA